MVGVIVEDGMRIDSATGVLLGPNLEPDVYSASACPLYIYNRSIRFYSLCRRYMVGPNEQVEAVVSKFCELEECWNTNKEKYLPRKYFLSQKLLCLELCKLLGFQCDIVKAISDKSRLHVQLTIYKDLFDTIKGKTWQRESTSANKQNNINFGPVRSSLSQVGTLPATPLEMLERLMTSRRIWHSSSE